jgi:hypothetical protein
MTEARKERIVIIDRQGRPDLCEACGVRWWHGHAPGCPERRKLPPPPQWCRDLMSQPLPAEPRRLFLGRADEGLGPGYPPGRAEALARRPGGPAVPRLRSPLGRSRLSGPRHQLPEVPGGGPRRGGAMTEERRLPVLRWTEDFEFPEPAGYGRSSTSS